MAMSDEQQLITLVEGELRDVARRVISRAFKPLGKKGELDIPVLRRIVAKLASGMWQDGQVKALRYVIGLAIRGLPKEQLEHGRGIKLSEAAFQFYNIDPFDITAEAEVLDGIGGDEDKQYGYLYNRLVERMEQDLSAATYRRVLKQLRGQIAKKLVALEEDHDKTGGRSTQKLAHRTKGAVPYTSRLEERQLTAWLKSNEKIAILAGDSGNGKSRMASEVLAAWSKKTAIEYVKLNAATPDRLFDTMQEWLDDGTESEFAKLRRAFIMALHKRPLSTILLLDDASDWELIEGVVQAASRCVITAEHDVIPVDYPHLRIDIGPLDVESSTKIVKWFRPDVSGKDANRLHDDVAGKPRLLIDCLGMFLPDEMTIDELCDCIESDSSGIISTVGKGSRSVDKAYSRYYTGLRTHNAPAALFLAAFAYLDQPAISLRIMQRVHERACELAGIDRPHSAAEAKLFALDLQNRYLVEVRDDKVYSHQLTRRIFKNLVTESRHSIYTALFDCYWTDRRLFDIVLVHQTLEWIPVIVQALRTIDVRDLLSIVGDDRISGIVVDAQIGSIQMGDSLSARVILDRFVQAPPDVRSRLVDLPIFFQWVNGQFENGDIGRDKYAAILEHMAKELEGVDGRQSDRVQFLWVAKCAAAW